MNPLYIVIMVNHIPLIGMVCLILLLIFAWWRGEELVRRLSLLAAILIGVAAIPAMMSIDPGQDQASPLAMIEKTFNGPQETLAKGALLVTLAMMVVAGWGLFLAQRTHLTSATVLQITLALAILAALVMALTVNRGESLRHPDLQVSPLTPGE